MNIKKTLIFSIILVSTLVVAVFFIKIRKESVTSDQGIDKVFTRPEISSNANEGSKAEAEKPEPISTVFIEGGVVSYKNNELKIKNGDIENTLAVEETFVVYQRNGDKIEKKNTTDLKAGVKIKAEVNMANSKILTVELIK